MAIFYVIFMNDTYILKGVRIIRAKYVLSIIFSGEKY